MEYDTLLSSYYIVEFVDENGSKLSDGGIDGKILWGYIEEDKHREFNIGDYICTTLIINQTDQYFQTMNTMYKTIKGTGKTVEIELNEKNLSDLRSGVDPELLLALKSENIKFEVMK